MPRSQIRPSDRPCKIWCRVCCTYVSDENWRTHGDNKPTSKALNLQYAWHCDVQGSMEFVFNKYPGVLPACGDPECLGTCGNPDCHPREDPPLPRWAFMLFGGAAALLGDLIGRWLWGYL